MTIEDKILLQKAIIEKTYRLKKDKTKWVKYRIKNPINVRDICLMNILLYDDRRRIVNTLSKQDIVEFEIKYLGEW